MINNLIYPGSTFWVLLTFKENCDNDRTITNGLVQKYQYVNFGTCYIVWRYNIETKSNLLMLYLCSLIHLNFTTTNFILFSFQLETYQVISTMVSVKHDAVLLTVLTPYFEHQEEYKEGAVNSRFALNISFIILNY